MLHTGVYHKLVNDVALKLSINKFYFENGQWRKLDISFMWEFHIVSRLGIGESNIPYKNIERLVHDFDGNREKFLSSFCNIIF